MRCTFARVALVLLVAGCASNAPPTQGNYSGFLKDYSDLRQTTDSAGETILRYVNPRLTPANYVAVIVDPVVTYPRPEPTNQVSQQTLDEIRNYLTTSLRSAIGSKARVVNAPGPGVARLQIAITGVASQTEGLKPYEVVPVAFVATMATNAVEGQQQRAKLLVEALATDSVTGEVLLKAVRSHTGASLQRAASNQPTITFDSVKPIIDSWSATTATLVSQYVKPR